MQQLMLPLLLAMDATKKGLLAFVQQMGMVALSELLATEAAMIAGPKGKHMQGRTHHHWGTGSTPVWLRRSQRFARSPARSSSRQGSRRRRSTLPSIEALARWRSDDRARRRADRARRLHARLRSAAWSRVDTTIEAHGASKSNASRALIDATTEKLAQFVVAQARRRRPRRDVHRRHRVRGSRGAHRARRFDRWDQGSARHLGRAPPRTRPS